MARLVSKGIGRKAVVIDKTPNKPGWKLRANIAGDDDVLGEEDEGSKTSNEFVVVGTTMIPPGRIKFPAA